MARQRNGRFTSSFQSQFASGELFEMARTVLTDDEMAGLVRKILMPGCAEEILDWMNWLPNAYTPRNPDDQDEAVRLKDLGFRDFKLQFVTFQSKNGSVVEADIHFSRKPKWFNLEAKRLFDHLFINAKPRYPDGALRSLHVPGYTYNFVFASELQLTLESSSDFVRFIFLRRYW